MATQILVVEDEQHLGIGIKYNLEAEGHRVTLVNDGRTALKLIQADHDAFQLIILDLMLPGMSGYTVCETIREAGIDIPVLILSARSLPEDRARGFDVGANQYLHKPFDLDELLSRVNNLLRLKPPSQRLAAREAKLIKEMKFGDATVNFDTYEASFREKSVKLTKLELKLLRYFAENEGRVISRQELLGAVWDIDGDMQTRTVDQYLFRLRKAFEDNPAQPKHFLTFRDAGYRFVSNPT